MRRLSVAAALIFLVALIFAGSARACSCAGMEPREALRQADAAIVGRLVGVVQRGWGQADFRYRVRNVYKGGRGIGLGKTISVRGSSQSSACGLPRRTGRRYGLLLARKRGRWVGGLCGLVEPRKLRSAAERSARGGLSGDGGSGGGDSGALNCAI